MQMTQCQSVASAPRTTIAVTGGTGFVGRHLMRALAQRPDFSIRLLSRSRPDFDFPTANLEVVTGDLADKGAVAELLTSGCTLVNLAYSNVSAPELNLSNSMALAQACAVAGISTVVHCSTASVFGAPNTRVLHEGVSCVPRSVYGVTKLQIEEAFSHFSNDSYRLFILRPTQVFGTGGPALKKLIEEIKHGNPPVQYVRECLYGERRLNLVSVSTLVNAILFMLSDKDVEPGIYVVSQDEWQENNYRYVADAVYAGIGKSKRMPRLSMPRQLLQTLLKLRGREEHETYRNYSSSKLIHAGFKNEECFPEALNMFISAYLTQR
jgi:nucleoside-diphosphate-sugar epimerase